MRYVWIVTIIFRIRNVLYAWNLFYLIRKIPSDLETKKYLEAVFNLEIKAGNPDPHMKFLYDQLTVLKDLPTIFKEELYSNPPNTVYELYHLINQYFSFFWSGYTFFFLPIK